MSQPQLQRQVDRVQLACSVASSIAKSAVKSYASGAALGFVSQIKELADAADTVKAIDDLAKQAKQLEAAGSSLVDKVIFSSSCATNKVPGVYIMHCIANLFPKRTSAPGMYLVWKLFSWWVK